MEKHINVVGVLYIVLSVFSFLGAFTIYFLFRLIGNFSDDYQTNMILTMIANVLAVVLVALSIPGIIGGIGLIKRKNWARILVLILSILNLFHFPLGTAIGIYAIWALLQPEVAVAFKRNNH
jgi:phage shock protein PspC (stress-responsive transcriptional regulator)